MQQFVLVSLRGSRDVVRRATAILAAERNVCEWGRRNLSRIALDGTGAGRTTEGRSAAVIANEEQCLSGVVRVRTWLAHELSSCNNTALRGSRRIWFFDGNP